MNVVLMLVFLIGGFVLLVKSADWFVDGACALSEKLKIPAYVIGLTVVAFGTSLPEAAVSLTASIQGSNEIAIGNVVGSNIFNTIVVLGVSALFSPIFVKNTLLKRDFPFCIGITALMLVLMLTLSGGRVGLTRIDGVILLVFFAAFMAFSIIGSKKDAPPEDVPKLADMPMWKCIVLILVGIVGVIAGGQLTVNGAKSLAYMVGLSEKVIALTVVAIGTSLPELVTSVIASRKNQNDLAVGNVIGSNIFNILFILGALAAVSPIYSDMSTVIDACVLLAVVSVTYVFTLTRKKLGRAEGAVMVGVYIAYTAYLLIR